MLASIYASKLYQASLRKDHIRAAMNDPMNAELVLQLEEYLNEESLPEVDEKVSESPEGTSEDQDAESLETSEDSEVSIKESEVSDDNGPKENHGLSEGQSLFKMPQNEEELAAMEKAMSGEGSDMHTEQEKSTPEKSEASTDVSNRTAIKACTSLSDLEVMKNTLNSVDSTCGVSRIHMKENEVWIYYSDDINLNTVMTDVIERLLHEGYGLEFNRLARSDNAIVFESLLSTQELQPVTADE